MAAPKRNKFADCPKIDNWPEYIVKDFSSEREMCDYIDTFAQLFAEDILECRYEGHSREYVLEGSNPRKPGPRVDFVFNNEDGIILVECKNVTQTYNELVASIGQLLSYIILAEKSGRKVKRSCLVVSSFIGVIDDIINRYNLPIDVFIFSKNQVLKLMN